MEPKNKSNKPNLFKILKKKIKGLFEEDSISESALTDIKVACLSDLETAKEIESYLSDLLDKFKNKKNAAKLAKVIQIFEFMRRDPTSFHKPEAAQEKTSADPKNPSPRGDKNSDKAVEDQKAFVKADDKPKVDDTPSGEKSADTNNAKNGDLKKEVPHKDHKVPEKENQLKKEVKSEDDPEKIRMKKEKDLEKQKEKELLKQLKQQEKELEKQKKKEEQTKAKEEQVKAKEEQTKAKEEQIKAKEEQVKAKEEQAKAKEADKQRKIEEAAAKKAAGKVKEQKVDNKVQLQQPNTLDSKEASKQLNSAEGKKEDVKRADSPKKEKVEQNMNTLNEIFKEVPFNNLHHSRFSLGDRPKFPNDVDFVFIEKPVSEMKSQEFEALEREICSFLNTRGGRIFFGINSKQIVVGDASPLSAFEKLALKIALVVEDGIYPPLQPKHIKIDVLPIQNSDTLHLLRIDVQKGENLKLYCTSKGKYFYRNQGVLVKYGPEEVQDIITMNAVKLQQQQGSQKEKADENSSNSEGESARENGEKAPWHHFGKDFKHWEKRRDFISEHRNKIGRHPHGPHHYPPFGRFGGHFDPRMMPPPFSHHGRPGFMNPYFQCSPQQQQPQQPNDAEFEAFRLHHGDRHPFFQSPFSGK